MGFIEEEDLSRHRVPAMFVVLTPVTMMRKLEREREREREKLRVKREREGLWYWGRDEPCIKLFMGRCIIEGSFIGGQR